MPPRLIELKIDLPHNYNFSSWDIQRFIGLIARDHSTQKEIDTLLMSWGGKF